jgi:phenylalanyl-tRNA synthetase alpha chain
VEIKQMACNLSEKLLQYLDGHERVDTLHLAAVFNVDHQKIIGAVKSLQALGDVSIAETMRYLLKVP